MDTKTPHELHTLSSNIYDDLKQLVLDIRNFFEENQFYIWGIKVSDIIIPYIIGLLTYPMIFSFTKISFTRWMVLIFPLTIIFYIVFDIDSRLKDIILNPTKYYVLKVVTLFLLYYGTR